MQIVKYILEAIYIIVCIALMIIVLKQNKDDQGASGTIVGSSSVDNFYEKNKGRTREGRLKKNTIILGITFFILSIVLGIVYVV